MGFFKKLFKGVKKVFKKIGKAVKSAFKSVGKFMGKIGIVGQLGLMLIAPYAMPMLGSLATSMMGTTLGGFGGAIIKGAGQFLNAAVKVGTRVGQAFKSVTSAVTGTIKNTVGATLKKMGLGNAVKGISGWDVSGLDFKTAFEKSGELWTKAGDDLGQIFSKSTFDSSMNKFGIEASLEEGFKRAGITDPVTTPNQQAVGMLEGAPADMIGTPLDGQTKLLDTTMGNVSLETMQLDPTQVGVAVDPSVQNFISQYEAPSLMSPPAPTASGPVALETMQLDPSQVGVSMEASTQNIINSSAYQAPTLNSTVAPSFQTAVEATAWEKAKAKAVEAGVPTTLMGVADYMAQEDVEEFEWPTVRQDYVDYASLAPSQIYPTSSGLAYSNMLTPDPFDAPSLSEAIANGDYKTLYQNDKGEGGFYYGAPSLFAAMAQNAQAQLYE